MLKDKSSTPMAEPYHLVSALTSSAFIAHIVTNYQPSVQSK
jgi:hypothetical protein